MSSYDLFLILLLPEYPPEPLVDLSYLRVPRLSLLQLSICGMCDVQQLALGVSVLLQLVVEVVCLMFDITQQLFLLLECSTLS
jgi:hypothetical protein